LEIEIPAKMKVLETHRARNRQKTVIQSAMLNVIFPDGMTGAITISKVVKQPWNLAIVTGKHMT